MKNLLYIAVLSAIPLHAIEIHKEIQHGTQKEDITITIPLGDEKLYGFQEILKELNDNPGTIESQQQPPTTCRERIFQNRAPLIAACATLGSATIAGTIALIVHFTAA